MGVWGPKMDIIRITLGRHGWLTLHLRASMDTSWAGNARFCSRRKHSTITTGMEYYSISWENTSWKRRSCCNIPCVPPFKHWHCRRIHWIISNTGGSKWTALRLWPLLPANDISWNRAENPSLSIFPFGRQRSSVVEWQQSRTNLLPGSACTQGNSLGAPPFLHCRTIIGCSGTGESGSGSARPSRRKRAPFHRFNARRRSSDIVQI